MIEEMKDEMKKQNKLFVMRMDRYIDRLQELFDKNADEIKTSILEQKKEKE